jgi:hypothetical protein
MHWSGSTDALQTRFPRAILRSHVEICFHPITLPSQPPLARYDILVRSSIAQTQLLGAQSEKDHRSNQAQERNGPMSANHDGTRDQAQRCPVVECSSRDLTMKPRPCCRTRPDVCSKLGSLLLLITRLHSLFDKAANRLPFSLHVKTQGLDTCVLH